jgi:hypothetical protein
MTTGTGRSAVPPAESIESFEDLYPRRVGLDDYVVLSLSEGGFTAYEVGLNPMECSCPDYRMQRDGPDICKHLAATLYQQPTFTDVDEDVLTTVANEMSELREEVGEAVRKGTEAKAEAAVAMGSGDELDSEEEEGAEVSDPVGRFEALLRDAGLDPGAFDLFVDQQLGSLQIDQTGYLESDEFGTWTEISDDLDLGYDPDDDVNYLTPDRFEEVLG